MLVRKRNRKQIVLDTAFSVIELDFTNFLRKGGNAEKYEIGYRVLRKSVADMLKPTKKDAGGNWAYEHDSFCLNDAFFKNSLLSDDRFGFEKFRTRKGDILIMVTLLNALEMAAKLGGKVIDFPSKRRSLLPRKERAISEAAAK